MKLVLTLQQFHPETTSITAMSQSPNVTSLLTQALTQAAPQNPSRLCLRLELLQSKSAYVHNSMSKVYFVFRIHTSGIQIHLCDIIFCTWYPSVDQINRWFSKPDWVSVCQIWDTYWWDEDEWHCELLYRDFRRIDLQSKSQSWC
jgi:hypothetical protein